MDSSIIKLSNDAQRHFPGTRAKAGLKTNSVVMVQAVVSGLSPDCVGQSLLASYNLDRYRGKILEAVIEKATGKNSLQCRAIGFWNADEKRYHW